MKRAEVARAVAAAATEHVVITSLGSAGRAWREHGGTNPTFYGSDPMGAAPAFALGAALARPDREFVLLEGDGDLTMGLGSLLTLAGAAPGNLRVVVFENGRYETGGGQPLSAAGLADIAALAAAAGWGWTRTVERDATAEDLAAAVTALLAARAPALLVVRVDVEPSPYGGPGPHSGGEARAVFQQRFQAWDHMIENGNR
ncbi:thiamine pyrophosphate-dependent enzyme [Streptosporangium sp. NBC_01810]|uniref:thiamine pyrophosphate-dependent enzyme n=1 Tax=Streptosporangium sp. NBC_01810 TaxID=2975951 RepID=UPI002DD8FAD5|nr:thiamine pyrophosphate-dependent enzyme [Streptosporangium sp. NBC_01810]WSA29014.1 thiamine pyrophosphate-dependent enzyme [Streptosporangium sp. NBC_01810]